MRDQHRQRAPLKIALIGCGAIGRSRHLPVLRRLPEFELVALVDRHPIREPEPWFRSLDAVMASTAGLDAVAVATPPPARADVAADAIDRKLAVLLEKPPAATLAEARALAEAAEARRTTLFAAWHSRFAPHVASAIDWLQGHRLVGGRLTWCEDVRKWHPGQDWIWRQGGMGVFDPGINGLSLLTLLHEAPLTVADVRFTLTRNADTPVAANFRLVGQGFDMDAEFDFRASEGETWRIELVRDDGQTAVLDRGGARWRPPGGPVESASEGEYESVYHRFADLVAERRSDVDLRPLALVEAAFDAAVIERLDEAEP